MFEQRVSILICMLTKITVTYFDYILSGNRLKFIRENQRELRVEHYQGLYDYLYNRASAENTDVGKLTILPSTFIVSSHFYETVKFNKSNLIIIGKS